MTDRRDVPANSTGDLRDEVREWVGANWDLDLTVRDWWARLCDAGYSQPTWPVGLGGRRATAAEARVVLAELARAGVVAPPVGHVAATLAAPTILQHGTDEQQACFLPEIARGEAAWCQLFSEPGSGSDLASVATRAERDGDQWIVTGQKVWNSGADSAQYGMLLARTNVDVAKHRGITYFLIEMDQPGVEVRPLRQMNGVAAFCEVFLTDARVASGRLLAGLGEGWDVARTTLSAEHASVSARLLSGMVAARSGPIAGDLDRRVGDLLERSKQMRTSRIPGGAVPTKLMIDLAREHGMHGDPMVRQRLAAYYTRNRLNAWTNQRIAEARGRLTGADGSIAKLSTSRVCQVSRDLSLAIVGAQGLLAEQDAPMNGDLLRVGLGSPGTRIGGGTDEVQLNVLGERALGLPREPDADRDAPYRTLIVGTQRQR